MVLTAEGRIFGWGRGSFGRLGTGVEKDCYSPVEVFLPGQLYCLALCPVNLVPTHHSILPCSLSSEPGANTLVHTALLSVQ